MKTVTKLKTVVSSAVRPRSLSAAPKLPKGVSVVSLESVTVDDLGDLVPALEKMGVFIKALDLGASDTVIALSDHKMTKAEITAVTKIAESQ